jgi:chromosome segregation ATPase
VSDPRSAEIAQEYSAHENAELRKEVDVLDGALSSKNESVIELAQTCEKLEAENSQLREREVELEAEGLRLVSELTKMWTATSCLQGLVKDLHAKIGAALEDKK